jgi:hypothetical protein
VLPPPSALPTLQIRKAKKLSIATGGPDQQQQQQQGAGVESDGGGGVLSPTAGSRSGRPGSARAAARWVWWCGVGHGRSPGMASWVGW